MNKNNAPMQGGLSNSELIAAWQKKLPGAAPTDRDLSAFAVGIEVGFAHAQELEKVSWMRIHYVLKDAGIHPGRTDDHLADVIAKALANNQKADKVRSETLCELLKLESDYKRQAKGGDTSGKSDARADAAREIHDHLRSFWSAPNKADAS